MSILRPTLAPIWIGDCRLFPGARQYGDFSHGGSNRNAESGHLIPFYRLNLGHIVKRDGRNMCSTEMKRLWHPSLIERFP
jgi:hypothetical protein